MACYFLVPVLQDAMRMSVTSSGKLKRLKDLLTQDIPSDEDSCVVDAGHCERGVVEGLVVGAESRAVRTNVVGGLETTFGLAKAGRLVHPVLGLDSSSEGILGEG